MKKNKEKFLKHFREIRDETEKNLANTINLDWHYVEELLEIDRKILEKIFHNLQILKNETMDVFHTSS